jgi:C4-dicarboxylate-specific signal transduction histidine kinase
VLFLNVTCIPLLMLAAVLQERKDVAAEIARREQQLAHLARVAVVGEVSGAVAHEVRQPLASMLANAEAAAALLAMKKIDLDNVRQIIADIVSDNLRAAQVIKRMQSMLRGSDAVRRPEQLNELVTETLELARADLHRRQVAIILNLAAELPRVSADRVQIQQVILNLLVNAGDAMEGMAAVERRVWICTVAHDRAGVELLVRDSGPGVEEEMLPRIFQPFVTTKAHGLGLGLSISRKIVVAHGGRLWVERGADGGAVFRMTLPLA